MILKQSQRLQPVEAFFSWEWEDAFVGCNRRSLQNGTVVLPLLALKCSLRGMRRLN